MIQSRPDNNAGEAYRYTFSFYLPDDFPDVTPANTMLWIFEEFKGTGNMELRLDRRLAERRVYPAIDIDGSSTRHEELLFDKKQLDQVWKLRRVLGALSDEKGPAAGLEMLMNRLEDFKTNDEFLAEVASSASPS